MESNKMTKALAARAETDIVFCSRFFLYVTDNDFASAILLTYIFNDMPADKSGLTPNQLRYSYSKLVKSGLLLTSKVAYPQKTIYTINVEMLNGICSMYESEIQSAEILQISVNEKLNSEKTASRQISVNKPTTQKPSRQISANKPTTQKPTSTSNHKPEGNSATIEEEGFTNNSSNNKPKATTSKKKGKPKVKTTSIEYMLSELLFELIVERRPKYFGECTTNEVMKIKRLRSWATHIKLMLSQDKRSKDEIADTIEWSQQHYFWKDNILSARKLRKNYGKLRIQMEKDEAINKRTVDTNPKITAEIIKHFEKAFLGKEVKWGIYDTGSFVIAAQRSVELADKSNLLIKNIPTLLIKCLKKWQMDNNKTVEPSYVKSNHTWDILLPQYFADVGISVHEEEESL